MERGSLIILIDPLFLLPKSRSGRALISTLLYDITWLVTWALIFPLASQDGFETDTLMDSVRLRKAAITDFTLTELTVVRA
jgi:hypothetical protein